MFSVSDWCIPNWTSALAFANKTEHENEQRVSSSCRSNSASSGLGIDRKQWKFYCLEHAMNELHQENCLIDIQVQVWQALMH